MQRIPTTDGSFVYRYDPYSLKLLPGNSYHDKVGAAIVFCEGKKKDNLKPQMSDSSPHKSQKALRRAHNSSVSPPPALDRSCSVSVSSNCGLSDAGSDAASPSSLSLCPVVSPMSAQMSSPDQSARLKSNTTHYARVQTKYGQELFIAPFRTSPGDVVVIENNLGSQHIGVVQSITTDAPAAETRSRVVRHARDADKIAFSQLQLRDAATSKLISEAMLSSPLFTGRVEVLGVEWLLDLSGVNVLCSHSLLDVDGQSVVRALQHAVACAVSAAVATPVRVNVLCSPGSL